MGGLREPWSWNKRTKKPENRISKMAGIELCRNVRTIRQECEWRTWIEGKDRKVLTPCTTPVSVPTPIQHIPIMKYHSTNIVILFLLSLSVRIPSPQPVWYAQICSGSLQHGNSIHWSVLWNGTISRPSYRWRGKFSHEINLPKYRFAVCLQFSSFSC